MELDGEGERRRRRRNAGIVDYEGDEERDSRENNGNVGDADSKKESRERSRHGEKHHSSGKDSRKKGEREEKERDSLKQHHRDTGKDSKERGKAEEDQRHRSEIHREKPERERDRHRDRERRERDDEHDKERKGREKEERTKERGKEKEVERERLKEKDSEKREREKSRDKERESHRSKDREREREKDDQVDRERNNDRIRENEKDRDRSKTRGKDRETERRKEKDRGKERDKESVSEGGRMNERDQYEKPRSEIKDARDVKDQDKDDEASKRNQQATSEVQERISKMKEERLKGRSEESSKILAWVNRSRKIEEKMSSERQKAVQLAKVFEEQDNVGQESSDDDDQGTLNSQSGDLAGVKVLHGFEKVIEGGAIVLTLKDQSVLSNGDINDEMDMLENIEIGEQKRRDEAYKSAKKTGTYDDKFNDDPSSEKRILPQYDEPNKDEGVVLDASGSITVGAEKKLEELRKRLQNTSTGNHYEDLTTTARVSSDYYTHEEMMLFRPKKKKSLRKKAKLDLDAMEAEAISSGLGASDLGSRTKIHRQTAREEKEKVESESRKNAYQAAFNKAEEASKAIRREQAEDAEEDNPVFGDDNDDLYRSLEKARNLALKKQVETEGSGPQAVVRFALSKNESSNTERPSATESQENKIVFTEMEEFVWGLQLAEDAHRPDSEDVFVDDDEVMNPAEEPQKDPGGWTEIREPSVEPMEDVDEEQINPDDTIHEVPVGKGLAGALRLLKDRGTLKETVDWGGRNMDKKKSKLMGIRDNEGPKEIMLDRLDEFGRIMTPKEAFRKLSHKFHGKGPGKMKQEKRMKQYEEELKLKQMKASDTPLLSMAKFRETQAKLGVPCLVLSGQMKPGQTSDPRSGFATVEKDHPGSLTPMLGDKKVEHFLGIKRKVEPSNLGNSKKPKT